MQTEALSWVECILVIWSMRRDLGRTVIIRVKRMVCNFPIGFEQVNRIHLALGRLDDWTQEIVCF